MQGPRSEIAGALVGIPLPKDHLILRAASESDGECDYDSHCRYTATKKATNDYNVSIT